MTRSPSRAAARRRGGGARALPASRPPTRSSTSRTATSGSPRRRRQPVPGDHDGTASTPTAPLAGRRRHDRRRLRHEILRMRRTAGAQPARPADADELGLARWTAPVDVAISPTAQGRLHLLRLRVPGRRLLRRPHDDGIIPSDRFASAPRVRHELLPLAVAGSTDTRDPQLGRLRQPRRTSRTSGTEPFNWLTDQETDLGDAELTRAGDKLVAVRGYDDSTHIVWYSVTGNALSGPKPPTPTAICADRRAGRLRPADVGAGRQPGRLERARRHLDPPRRGRLRRRSSPRSCCPAAREADWGPANVNPGPRATTGGGGRRPAAARRAAASSGGGTAGGGDRAAGVLAEGGQRASCASAAACSKVKIGCAAAARYGAKLTLKGRAVARKKGSLKKARLRPSRSSSSAKQARAVRKLGARVEGAQARRGSRASPGVTALRGRRCAAGPRTVRRGRPSAGRRSRARHRCALDHSASLPAADRRSPASPQWPA